MMNSWSVLLVAITGIVFVTSETNGTNCKIDDKDLYHSDGPQIIPCQKEVILENGQNYTLICRANTPVEFIQQEPAEENVGNSFNITQLNSTDENAEYKYEVQLEFTNVDRYSIGFYACISKDSNIDRNILEHLVAEPNNTADISYIYIYVHGSDSLFAPMREVVMGKKGYYVAECRPTTPDVEVTITVDIPEITYSPKIGFIYDSDTIDAFAEINGLTIIFTCGFKKQHRKPEEKDLILYVHKCSVDNNGQREGPKPTVVGGYNDFLLGEKFVLNCSAYYTENTAVHLKWLLPDNSLKVKNDSNNNAVVNGIVYLTITIENATKAHAGTYTCLATSHCGEKAVSFEKKCLDKPYLNYKSFETSHLKEGWQIISGFSGVIYSYPPATFAFYKNNIKLENNKTFEIINNSDTGEVALKIHRRNVEDSDIYTLNLTNPYLTKNDIVFDIRFKVIPTVKFDESDKTCVLNSKTSLQCEILGYPLPTVEWIFNGTRMPSTNITVEKIYKERAILQIPCYASGFIMCNAINERGQNNKTRKLLVYELPGGFGIFNQPADNITRFPEGQLATVKCVASIHQFSNVTWEKDGKLINTVEYSRNQFSLVAKLRINNTSSNDSGKYTCRGIRFDGTTTFKETEIKVSPLEAPKLIFTNDIDGNVLTYQPISMFCQAEGIPRPEIKWFKDNIEFKPEDNDNNVKLNYGEVDYKTVNSSIFIAQMKEEHRGEYECVATNSVKEARNSVILTLKEAAYVKYVIAIAIIVLILVILVIYLTCKVKKEKRFRKELAAAGLLYFKEGVTKSLNPDLGIDEQAELLPYNEKFEFPADKLVFGKQLGAGAFGVVYKADARGIINAEETTPVAVKMVKKTADNMYIKALASELKIMVHLGKHVNIVNLLGACTKNVGKRELVVIVEYCKFGNIHNYMQRHREVFIDQFSDTNKEKSFGKVNRGYDSSGSTGLQSDYGTANTQDTDHTFLTNNTNRTSRKNVPSQPTDVKASEGYVQPEWRSNYESDYSYDGRSPRPLTSRDLLAWAFQIARGMEYLASRKVLHGDLAARNILLADDNIVKICDFGLARSIYKNDEYQKKENSLLPVKWLAIECMTDRIFSTQSDVWSFGIVLWELFTLAKTPYPNMSPAHLLQFLREGHRLEKPAYSDDRIYNLMKRCWEEKPTTRPSFTQLQETLGTFLDDNVRNYYVDLNTAYMDGNTRPAGQEDYLAMVSAPDYNNMVTPSPHHYVNDLADPRRFFPPSPSKVDEDGYLQMSPAHHNIFSPKSTSTNFDFDPRKFNTRASEASSGGSELTPMLTLNNLPRSGSDSDHEGNASPFPNVCPRIDEEPDEVFDSKQNKKTLNQNAKNAQITNATNPMYITFDMDVQKKPIDNSYVNIVPNGLVK